MHIEQNKMWDQFYSGNTQVFFPSEFAKAVLPRLELGWSILDAGCGNGRDSIFFAQNGLNVTAVDMSQKAIARLREQEPKVRAVCGNVLTAEVFSENNYEGIYSRFFIHALTAAQETVLLKRFHTALKPGGQLFIETRCVEDELCGTGDRISDTEWAVDGHYRRFIVPEELAEQLSALGFTQIQWVCARGFAPFEDADPVIMRITAEKPKLENIHAR